MTESLFSEAFSIALSEQMWAVIRDQNESFRRMVFGDGEPPPAAPPKWRPPLTRNAAYWDLEAELGCDCDY